MFDTGAVSQNSVQHFRMFAVGLVLQENLSLRCSCYEGFNYDLSSSVLHRLLAASDAWHLT